MFEIRRLTNPLRIVSATLKDFAIAVPLFTLRRDDRATWEIHTFGFGKRISCLNVNRSVCPEPVFGGTREVF